MATIKVHGGSLLAGSGLDDCDFRGDKFIGKPHGDEHRTILEGPDPIESVPLESDVAQAMQTLGLTYDQQEHWAVGLVLRYGPFVNRILDKLKVRIFGAEFRLRVGVWDN